MKRILFLAIATVFAAHLHVRDVAATPLYEGKTIRIIVGYQAGGGFDAYARLVARHMGKYIAGYPKFVIENMVGAGSLISANYLFNAAKPDGLTIAHFSGGHFISQILNKPGIEFDARKFEYIGAPLREDSAFVFSRASGVTSLEKWISSKVPVKLGGCAPGAHTPDNVIRIAAATVRLPIQLVSGYKGIPDIRLAIESGELAGSCWTWSNVKAGWSKKLQSGDAIAVLQAVPKPFSDLREVPLLIDLAKTEEDRQLIDVGVHDNSISARPFALPPGTNKDLVRILRKAFQLTFEDREFLLEAEKANLEPGLVTGEEIENAVLKIFKISTSLRVRLDDILFR